MDFSKDFICNTFYHDNTTGKIYRKKDNKEFTSRDKDGYILVDATYEKGKQGRMRGARLVWVMYNEEIPEVFVIDHLNRVRDDNRIENLRLATPRQNSSNSLRCDKANLTSKYKGVQKEIRGKWRASIQEYGKTTLIGLYSTEEAAAFAYNVEAESRYGEFAHMNDVPAVDLGLFSAKNIGGVFESKNGLPRGLCIINNKFVYRLRGKHLATFSIEHKEEAILFTEHFNKTNEQLVQEENLQMFNRLGLPKNITKCSTGYRASFLHSYKRYHVGTFATLDEATTALNKKRQEVIDDDKEE